MDELVKNMQMFLASAQLVYKAGDYTSATILLFKAVFVATDIILLKAEGKTPKDHTERFRMIEQKYPDLYLFLDKYFAIYRDTYSVTIEKIRCDEVKNHVENIIKRYKLQ